MLAPTRIYHCIALQIREREYDHSIHTKSPSKAATTTATTPRIREETARDLAAPPSFSEVKFCIARRYPHISGRIPIQTEILVYLYARVRGQRERSSRT